MRYLTTCVTSHHKALFINSRS